MRKIIENNAYNILKEKGELILNSVLINININHENYYTDATLSFKKNENDIKANVIINLKKVKVFNFYYDDNIYYIVDYKIINESNEYYLSLDPDNSIDEKSNSDCGVIIFESLEVEILD